MSEHEAKSAEGAQAEGAQAGSEAAPPEPKPPWLADPATPEWAEADEDPIAETLAKSHPDTVVQARSFAGDLILDIAPAQIRIVCADLKERGYSMLVDLCGVDYPDREQRFEVIYHLYSFDDNRRIRLRVAVGEGEEVPSVCEVWRAANWMEREAFDMYGVRFTDHPDMTRILTWEGFNGYPLRKDFPVEGVDTGAAIYPEYYEDEAGPVAGTGTGWKPPQPPDPEPPDQDPDPEPESDPGPESGAES